MKLIRVHFVVLFAFYLLGCTTKSVDRNPGSLSYIELEKMAAEIVKIDTDLVRSPEHATKFYLHGQKTQKAILVMHGLHESPNYMKGFANHFFNQGYTVISLRLPGHLTKNTDEINQVRSPSWIKAAEDAMQLAHQFSDHVEVLGYSTGGTLGVHLALHFPQIVKRLYLIAPALTLSNRTFLAGFFVGWTKIDLLKVCADGKRDTLVCKAILLTDKQLEPMLKENLNTSPMAGLQVQMVISNILERFLPKPANLDYQNESNYYENVKEVFNQLSLPIFMVNSEADVVVGPRFNHMMMSSYKGKKGSILFESELNVLHIGISKAREDAFKDPNGTYNPHFSRIIDGIKSFTNQ